MENIKKEELLPFAVDIKDSDLSFVYEMVDSGISDDGTPLVGDVSFEDTSNYDTKDISHEEINQYLKSLNLNLNF